MEDVEVALDTPVWSSIRRMAETLRILLLRVIEILEVLPTGLRLSLAL